MACFSCGRDLHDECGDPCCCQPVDSPVGMPQSIPFSQSEERPEVVEIRRGRPRSEDETISTSAGRKRAAAEYPIDPEAPCDWRGLSNCGGGKFPIVGCLTGMQTHRHHGPVKRTTRNERTNIHLICTGCHNTWHAKNDYHYNETDYNELPHNPRQATASELLSRGKS